MKNQVYYVIVISENSDLILSLNSNLVSTFFKLCKKIAIYLYFYYAIILHIFKYFSTTILLIQ